MDRRRFLQTTGVAAALAFAARGGSAADEATEDEPVPTVPYALVDTHVHFWDPDHLRYPWLDNSDLLNQVYMRAEYDDAIAPYTVDQIVFVQAECIPEHWEDEARWVAELAEEDGRIQGIVASAPLEEGEGAFPMLERLAELPHMRGIRRLLQGEADPEFMLQPDFVAGVQALPDYDMTFDLGVHRGQLPAVIELVGRCPEVQFMLNHIAVPDIRGGNLDPWRDQLRTLSELPNVYCKMSGVATAADHDNWTPADLRPAIEHVLDCFGFDRTAFGSDWPVMLLATTFPRWVDALSEIVADASESEKRRLFRETAQAFYRLPV